ncbi:uncharacterized protein LOC134237361 [Saccostrea cucullata]|uniref:uncharacterized protein LOC134237361 n=1 Tax=Saccostrea cuccullata TaxID=36930 RepID=UPI002ED4AFE0
MDEIPRISDVVYRNMCSIVGTPTIIIIRRDLTDIKERLRAPAEKSQGYRRILSGSKKEGFRSQTSDYDYMHWPTDQHVICDLKDAHKYSAGCTLILMEYSDNLPGFVMLKLLTRTGNWYIILSSTRINDGLYISSAMYRENKLKEVWQNSTHHGPCATVRIVDIECDSAHCFACKDWPSIAYSFIQRSQTQGWPLNNVLRDIINSGCHVVPIGFKGSPQEDCEWRISFSVAEQKLVWCMNHTQFMCYGLLKLFLKEVLTVKDTNGQPLLCSYFMKTTLFWVIQNNTELDWTSSTLLSGFWLCFKFLLSCVHRAYLPNFFIPENNMFITKVFGHSQQILYERLFDIYKLGISCLFNCKSLKDCFTKAVCNRLYVLSTAESDIVSEITIDACIFQEIHWLCTFLSLCTNTLHCFTILHSAVGFLNDSGITAWKRVALRKFISTILRCAVYHLLSTSSTTHNKSRLRTMYVCLNILKVCPNMGCISDGIYLGLFLFSVGKNEEAITKLTMIKRILTQPYIMHVDVKDQQGYIDEVGRLPLSEKMRKAVAMSIELNIPMIKELELECRMTLLHAIFVPPYVMTLMLLVLSYCDKPDKRQEVLKELYSLLHYDKNHYIFGFFRDISWQILGICQQICGDYQGALLSFQKSLIATPLHGIQEATYYRIQDVQYRNQNS